jgi:REP element-mobilizing transposase RayT
MRKEQFGVGTFVHVVNRGAHQISIVRDDNDRWRFLKLLRYLNDSNVPNNWEREISPNHIRNNFLRPADWLEAEPYVALMSYCLMDNHFHLLLRELVEGGISKYMQRLSKSVASHFNAKYEETGSLFQGPYRARVIDDDVYLQYVAIYINIKNPFELYPGGLKKAVGNFQEAYTWAMRYPFASTSDFAGIRSSSLIDQKLRRELFASPEEFRFSARELMEDRIALTEEHRYLALEF